jgi:hypothetical protein
MLQASEPGGFPEPKNLLAPSGTLNETPPTTAVAEDDDPISLRSEDWEVLLQNLHEGSCTPFLGAGASTPPLPTAGKLAEDWAAEFNYPLEDSHRDLSRVAQFLAVTRAPTFPKIKIRDLFNSYPDPDFRGQALIHSLLAELPLPVYVTTNYDDYMSRALQAKGKDPKREICRWNKVIGRIPSVFKTYRSWEPSKESPVVFHLHGYKDVPNSLVLTEDDYVDFLIRMDQDDDDLLPPRIQEAFSGASLLFMGYGLSDWNFRVLFRTMFIYLEKSIKTKHVSVQLAPLGKGVSKEKKAAVLSYLNNYFGELGIRVYWGTCQQFAKDLRDKWKG